MIGIPRSYRGGKQRKKGAGMIRRFGSGPKGGVTYTLRHGAYALISDGQDLLLTEQETDLQLELQLPGGGIDPGESTVAALHREILEETGWRVSGLKRIGAYRWFTYMPEYDLWAEKLCAIYSARPALRVGPPSEAGHRPIWMSACTAADRLFSPGDRFFAQQACEGALPVMLR